MELDILLDKLQKVYQEVDDVGEHLLKHYLKSESVSYTHLTLPTNREV